MCIGVDKIKRVTAIVAVGFFMFVGSVFGNVHSLLLKNARIVDVNTGNVSKPTQILVIDGIIQAMGKSVGENFDGKTVDLCGKFVLPGLINAHIHLGNDPEESWEHREKVLKYLLEHGITAVRDAAGDARILKELKHGVETGEIVGPDIYYSAFVAGEPYYRGNDRERNMVIGLDSLYAPWLQCICPSDDLDKAMKVAIDCGATGVKIYGGLSRKELFPLVIAAKKAGLKVWGHATLYPAKPTDMADSGVEVLSHAYLLEWEGVKEDLSDNIFDNYERFYEKIDRNSLDLSIFIRGMKKSDAIFDPTLYLCLANGMEWTSKIVRQLHQAGIRICAGTDWMEDIERPYPFLIDEIELYVEKCGFSPLEACRTATIIAAEVIGREKEMGSIEEGKCANLFVVKGNPLDDIKFLRDVFMVIKNGKVIKKGI